MALERSALQREFELLINVLGEYFSTSSSVKVVGVGLFDFPLL